MKNLNSLTQPQRRAYQLCDQFAEMLKASALADNVDIAHFVEPMLQQTAWMAVAAHMTGNPQDFDKLLEKWKFEVSETIKAALQHKASAN
jgi:hypothetical protein